VPVEAEEGAPVREDDHREGALRDHARRLIRDRAGDADQAELERDLVARLESNRTTWPLFRAASISAADARAKRT